MGGKSGGDVTVGYHYYMNVHFALCHSGVDELMEIRIGDRTAWQGSIAGAGSALIVEPYLFGGEKREGGVMGVVDFMPGNDDQPVNSSLLVALNKASGASAVPSYRGVTTAFFKGFDGVLNTGTPWEEVDKSEVGFAAMEPEIPKSGIFRDFIQEVSTVVGVIGELGRSSFMWSGLNPYFKNPKFLIRRNWNEWYPEKARVGNDANPAHIIYECLTNDDWGLGYPVQDVDSESFAGVADDLYDEALGLSLKWTTQTRVQEFIEMVLEHINGTLIEDRRTGKFRLTLVRDGYDETDLFELNEDNCILEDFQRKTLGDTVNEVTVAYTRWQDGETDTVSVQDLANFSNTGKINSQKKEYPGVRTQELAMRLALRDLNTMSKPIAKVTLTCDRSILGHYPGDVVKLNWPRLGIDGLVIRIGAMDLGTPGDGKITVEAVEDVFALPSNSYVTPQPPGWVDPARDPEPVLNYKVFEPSYYEIYTSTSSADRMDWPEDVGFTTVVAEAPNPDSRTLTLHDDIINEDVGQGEFTEFVELTQEADYLDGTLHVDIDDFDATLFLQSGFGWLGDELIEVVGFDILEKTITVNRALVDTVPAKHPIGERLWFYRKSDFVLDPTPRVAGETVDYKLLPGTSRGKLPESKADVIDYTLQNRQLRPYPPGNLRIEGEYEYELVSRYPEIEFSTRNRLQQTAGLVYYKDGNITPEQGVRYVVSVESPDGVVQASDVIQSSPFVLSESVVSGLFNGGYYNFTLRLRSERDGLSSWQSHRYDLGFVGYGLKYGRKYGGLHYPGVVLAPGSTSYTPAPPTDTPGEFYYEGEPFYDFEEWQDGIDNDNFTIIRDNVLWEVGGDSYYGLNYSTDNGVTWQSGNEVPGTELEGGGGPYYPRYMFDVSGETYAVCQVPGLSGFHIVKRSSVNDDWVNVLGTTQRITTDITPLSFFYNQGRFYILYMGSSYPTVEYGLKHTNDLTVPYNDWPFFFVGEEEGMVLNNINKVYKIGDTSGTRNVEMGNGRVYLNFSYPNSEFDLQLTDESLQEVAMQTKFKKRSVEISTGSLSTEFYDINGPSSVPDSYYRYKADRLDYYNDTSTGLPTYLRTSYWPDEIGYDTVLGSDEQYLLNPYLTAPVVDSQGYLDPISATRSRMFVDARGIVPIFDPNYTSATADMKFVNLSPSSSGRLVNNASEPLPFATPYEGGTVAYSDLKITRSGEDVPVFRRFETSTYWSSFIHSGRRYFEVTVDRVFNNDEIKKYDDNDAQVSVGVLDLVPYRAIVRSTNKEPVPYTVFIDNSGWINDARSWLDKKAAATTQQTFGSFNNLTTPEYPNFYENSNYPDWYVNGSIGPYARLSQSRSAFDRYRVPKLYPGDVVGVVYDASNSTVSFYINGNEVFSASQSEDGVNLETVVGFVDVRNAKAITNTGQLPFKHQPSGTSPWGDLVVVS